MEAFRDLGHGNHDLGDCQCAVGLFHVMGDEMIERVRNKIRDWADENPLWVGVVALVAVISVSMLLLEFAK